MLVTLDKDADPGKVQAALQGLGLWTQRLESRCGAPPSLVVEAWSRHVPPAHVAEVEGVADVAQATSPHPLVDALRGRSVVVGSVAIGGGAPPVLVAGPCSVESPGQIMESARLAAAAGAELLRGGAFKPRTSPYSFAGHGREALSWLREAADAHSLAVVTEVTSEHDVEAVAAAADMLQIGSRNMQSFALLAAVGQARKPVMLKRGMAATVHEWLMAAEHLLCAGAAGVVLCERGVLGFDPSTRNLLDLAAVALLHHVYGLPVLVDPSHATGRRDLVTALSRGALGCGADGLVVECHPDAARARSDGPQALSAAELEQVGRELRRLRREAT